MIESFEKTYQKVMSKGTPVAVTISTKDLSYVGVFRLDSEGGYTKNLAEAEAYLKMVESSKKKDCYLLNIIYARKRDGIPQTYNMIGYP